MADRILTQPSYIVVSAIERAYIHERYADDLGRRQVVADIASGQYEALTQVIEVNVSAGSCRDVTKEILCEVAQRWDDNGEPLEGWQADMIGASLRPHPQYVAWDKAADYRKQGVV